MAISTKVEALSTYNYYPRAHYFHKRLLSLHERFHNILDLFPSNISETDKISKIDKAVKTYEKPPRLVVHSNAELRMSDMVVSMEPQNYQRHHVMGNGIDIVVIYIEIARADAEGIRIAESVIKTMKTEDTDGRSYNIKNANGTVMSERVFLWCKVDPEGVVALPWLEQALHVFLRDHFDFDGPFDDKIIIYPTGLPLQTVISNYLEESLITIFEKVQSCLDEFLPSGMKGPVEGEIIEQKALHESIQAFVSNKWHINDILNQREAESAETSTSEMQAEERYLVYICEELANVVKCSVSVPLSHKFCLPVTICNDMMMANSSKQKFIDALSTSTKSIMKRLFSFREHERDYEPPAKTDKHNYMVDRIRNDLSKPLKDVEILMKSTRENTVMMGKMKYEINAYLRQSILQQPEVQEKRPDTFLKMKKAVLGLDHVFGCGTFYGQFEIHLSQKDQGVEELVREIIRQHGYAKPYAVKVVEKMPIKFADMQHEHGKLIYTSPHGDKIRKGTLGGFVEDEQKKELFAVTCAHVVRPGNHPGDLDVFVDESYQRRRLGVSTAALALYPGEIDLIDMAAVKIAGDIRHQCVRFLKDEDGINRLTELVESSQVELYLGKDVYKYGAVTGCTTGIVCCEDYYLKIREMCGPDTPVVVIEDLPGSLTSFATPGDSGAFVCLQNPGSDIIKALSLFTGGDLKICDDPTPKHFTFLLQRGLQEMFNKSGIRLNLCAL